MTSQELYLCVRQLLFGKEGQHSLPEQMRMHRVTQPHLDAVDLHNLLNAHLVTSDSCAGPNQGLMISKTAS